MEERDLIPEIDPALGLTEQQVQSRTPAGKPVYSGKSEKEIVLTHCFTFFNLIFQDNTCIFIRYSFKLCQTIE